VEIERFVDDNWGMSEVATTNVPLPTDLVRELEEKAKRMGLNLPAYVGLIARAVGRRHDEEFLSAARFVFSKYPNALRKLAK